MTVKELPKKEATLFKNMLKMYEYKQYKQGLKSADAILKKFPDHGESLVVKGLFLSNLNRKDEGFALAKKGLTLNLTSGVSWQVFGIMNRTDKNYEEALKAFVNALKYDKDNFQLLRDICTLHVHLRNYSSFNEVSQYILNARPANRAFWSSLAVSYHLVGNLELATQVLDCYVTTFEESNNTPDYEHSEILLYRNELIQQAGHHQRALTDLIRIKSTVFDKLSHLQLTARAQKNLGQVMEASESYRSLIKLNPDNKSYLSGLFDLEGLNKNDLVDSELDRMMILIDDLKSYNPKSNLLKFLPLKYLKGDKFDVYGSEYVKASIEKGVPSLFVNVKSLFGDKTKQDSLFKSVEQIYQINKDHSNDEEPHNGYLWSLYYLAQHYDKVKDYAKALELVELAITHAPKQVELYMTKARIFKHQNKLDEASKIMDQARQLDLSDRHVNTKSVKYMLRNDQVELAEQTIILFIRPDCTDKLAELADIQCLWFALESAKSRFRTKQYGLALKKCHLIVKNFGEFDDDQFDFHGYCMRKSTVRPYIKTLVFEDNLYSHNFYLEAVNIACQCYMAIANDPLAAKNSSNPEMANLTSAEKKKLKLKQKKAQAKANLESEGSNESKDKKDEDPKGLLYLNTKTPLEDGYKLIQPALQVQSTNQNFLEASIQLLIQLNKLTMSVKLFKKLNNNSNLLEKLNHAIDNLSDPLKKALHSELSNTDGITNGVSKLEI